MSIFKKTLLQNATPVVAEKYISDATFNELKLYFQLEEAIFDSNDSILKVNNSKPLFKSLLGNVINDDLILRISEEIKNNIQLNFTYLVIKEVIIPESQNNRLFEFGIIFTIDTVKAIQYFNVDVTDVTILSELLNSKERRLVIKIPL